MTLISSDKYNRILIKLYEIVRHYFNDNSQAHQPQPFALRIFNH